VVNARSTNADNGSTRTRLIRPIPGPTEARERELPHHFDALIDGWCAPCRRHAQGANTVSMEPGGSPRLTEPVSASIVY
jgi:hypothetical protein